jgi:hypothetical protein
MQNMQTTMIPEMEIVTSETADPEQILWIAVLNQAIRDTRTLVRKIEKNPDLWADYLFRTNARNLTRYFKEQSMDLGGFGFICELIQIDSEQAFQRIDELYLRHLNHIKSVSKSQTFSCRKSGKSFLHPEHPSDRYCDNVSFPHGLKKEIKKAALKNHRSMNAEIVFRILGADPESDHNSFSKITNKREKSEKKLEAVTA